VSASQYELFQEFLRRRSRIVVVDMNGKNQSMVNGSRITVRILTGINILKEDGRQAGGTTALMM